MPALREWHPGDPDVTARALSTLAELEALGYERRLVLRNTVPPHLCGGVEALVCFVDPDSNAVATVTVIRPPFDLRPIDIFTFWADGTVLRTTNFPLPSPFPDRPGHKTVRLPPARTARVLHAAHRELRPHFARGQAAVLPQLVGGWEEWANAEERAWRAHQVQRRLLEVVDEEHARLTWRGAVRMWWTSGPVIGSVQRWRLKRRAYRVLRELRP